MPDTPDHRRGVPQDRQFHALWSRGAQQLEELFPGIRGELVDAGATVCDDGDLSQVSIRVVLSAVENSSALTEKLYRSMNLVDPPTDYSPLLQG